MSTCAGHRFACGLLAWALLLGGAMPAGAATQTLPAFGNRPAPDFDLPDVDGHRHRLSDYRGKLVVLNFWATWCPPCRREMPSMERARRALKGDKIVILAVDVGEDEDTVFKFTADFPVRFPLLLDRKGKVVKEYPVVGLPTTYIINAKGYITHRAVGSRDWDAPAMLKRLRKLAGD
ncbi:MAG: TlpA disulfide reductase family protein [Gammaproteobacteria bacterium]